MTRRATLKGHMCIGSPTMEQRLHFLTESFRELDLEGQQYLLTIIGALSLSKSNGMEY
jgi:hypothetical protein